VGETAHMTRNSKTKYRRHFSN